MRKRLTPATKDKKVTNSKSSLKPWKWKKMCHWINTSEKEGLLFVVTKTLKYINKNLYLKLEMVFYNSLSYLKPMSHFSPMLLNIQES